MYICVGKIWHKYAWEHYLSNIQIKNCILIQNKNRPKFMNSFRKAHSLQNVQQLHSSFRNHNRLKRFKYSTTWNVKAIPRFVLDVENKLMVTRGIKVEETHWETGIDIYTLL